jgi:ribose transport system ATP-binding protein
MPDLPTNPVSSDVLLQARGISKSFPGVRALDGVDITVRRGRLNALLGENGAGKSTLMNILAGVFPPDAGEIRIDDRLDVFQSPGDAQRAGLAIIHQELNLLPELSVAENIFLGREPRTRLGLIDYSAMHRDAAALLSQLDLVVDPRTPVGLLRLGAQQVVEIAKALSFNARVLIMDEPTSALSDQEVDALFRLISQLKSRGVGLIYITHKLDELTRIADDVTVLRDGRCVAADAYGKRSHDELIRLMVGRELSELFAKSRAAISDEMLRLENVSLRRSRNSGEFTVSPMSLTVHRGEIVGLFGLMGAGRTELLQCLFGLHPRLAAGAVWIDGTPQNIRSPREAIAAGLALAPEDRKVDGLVLSMSVAQNIGLATHTSAGRFGLVNHRRENHVALRYVRQLGIKTPHADQPVRHLSGGNQQKVVLSKWMVTEPKVLLLDEPTRGIDINAKREIYSLINELAHAGLAVLMASSELPEILAIADRILVLAEGRVTGEFRRHEANEEILMRAALISGRAAFPQN